MNDKVLQAKQWLSERPKLVGVAAVIGLPVVLLGLVGGYIITVATIFALVGVIAVAIIIWKLGNSEGKIQRKIYETIRKHPLASDIIFSGAIWYAAPGGVTGLLAAACAAVMISGLILIMPSLEDRTNGIKETEPAVAQATA